MKQRGQGATAVSETALVVEQRVGEVVYLQAAIQIMADLRKIWGLDAPTKLSHSVTDPASAELSKLSDDEQERYYGLLQKMEAGS